jgi:hypothetical protein
MQPWATKAANLVHCALHQQINWAYKIIMYFIPCVEESHLKHFDFDTFAVRRDMHKCKDLGDAYYIETRSDSYTYNVCIYPVKV